MFINNLMIMKKTDFEGGKMVDLSENSDFETLAMICKGLSHPTKWMVYKILEQYAGESHKMEIAEVIRLLRSEFGFKQEYVRGRYHIEAMEEAGIVKIYEHKNKNDEVELLVKVKFDYEWLKKP